MDDSIAAHGVTQIRHVMQPEEARAGERPNDVVVEFAGRRRSQPLDTLLPCAVDWFLRLPPSLRPHKLADRYPRIANCLCVGWLDPEANRRYMDDLMFDRRGGRRGFEPDVALEVRRLREYYAGLYPSSAGETESVLDRM